MDKSTLLQLYLKVCEVAGVCFWEWDLRTDVMLFQNFQDFFKDDTNKGQLTLGEWLAYLLPEDREAALAAISECTEGGSDSYVATMRMRLKDGSVIWAQDRGWVAERDAAGRPTRLIGLQQNITHIKAMERDLQEAKAHLDVIADISGLIPWEWDCRERRLSLSRNFLSTFGYESEEDVEGIRSNWLSVVHPDDHARIRSALEAYLNGQADSYREEVRMRCADGGYLWMLTSGTVSEREDNGVPVRLVGGLLNINYLKTTRDALAAALAENRLHNERLQREMSIVEENLHLSKGYAFRQRRLLSVVNAIALDLLSAKPDDIGAAIQRSLQSVGQSANADRVYIMRNCGRDETRGLQVVHAWHEGGPSQPLPKDGEFLRYADLEGWEDTLKRGEFINAHVHTLPDSIRGLFERQGIQSLLLLPVLLDGVFWGVIYFGDTQKVRLSDEPELKTLQSSGIIMVLEMLRNETLLLLTDAMQAARASQRTKTMMLANVSHEMKTPLNAILGMSALARRDPQNLRECLDTVDAAARRLLDVITDMLDMASLETGQFALEEREFTLSELLDGILNANSEAARAKNLTLSVNADCDAGLTFLADSPRLQRAVNCLVDNAVKFTPEGGSVRVDVSRVSRAEGALELAFAVRDTGIGIEADALSSVFLPLEQLEQRLARSFDGVGLGLAVAQGIVKTMGGSITVSSTPGRGSLFTISAPLRLAGAGEQADESVPALKTVSGTAVFKEKHIIVADDNEINREILKALLEEVEATVHLAENGQETVDMIATRPDRYDMVLMDIHMPVMDGYEATKQIRALPSGIPIVAVTANNLPQDCEERRQAGMDGYVGKPVDFERMLQVMRPLLADEQTAAV